MAQELFRLYKTPEDTLKTWARQLNYLMQNLDTTDNVTIGMDSIGSEMIDWGTGDGQVDLADFIAGNANRVTVTSDGDGSVTLSAPQDLHTAANPTFANITGSGLVKGATGQFGNVAGGHYSAFEADGTLKYNGDATVYNDLALPIIPRTTGLGRPTLATFSGNIREFTMAVNDITDVNATELLHQWAEGTEIELHVHWATNGSNVDDRFVKWEIDYTWANKLNGAPSVAFPAADTRSAETTIPAGTPDKTHLYTSVYSFTPTGGKIGAYLCMSLKRIAASGTAPTSDPWILAVGVHYKNDTAGSRSVSGK